MSRRKKEPFRALTDEELAWLKQISRSQNEPSSHVARAKQILNVANGSSYQEAARLSGRKSGDAVSQLVQRFNREGIQALEVRHDGGPVAKYGATERERILQEVRRTPEPEIDGTTTWSLKTLSHALRHAADGLPEVSEDTIRTVFYWKPGLTGKRDEVGTKRAKPCASVSTVKSR